ncbi:uncharacterized protein LOC120107183 [Phoenix dactylifera]|uniref:Uncharacterized protein LOC120107183 n=1 Tax=Phoenix dactylifera TaxID=42345 RepID=A0A8B8ZSD7_PHODC|nr:uncharacterized protein LOC120107183 [Phoenix dactylifera]
MVVPAAGAHGARVVKSDEERRRWRIPEVEPNMSEDGGEQQATGVPRSGNILVQEQGENREEGGLGSGELSGAFIALSGEERKWLWLVHLRDARGGRAESEAIQEATMSPLLSRLRYSEEEDYYDPLSQSFLHGLKPV